MYVTKCSKCGKMHWAFGSCNVVKTKNPSQLIEKINYLGGFVNDDGVLKLHTDIHLSLTSSELREIADYLDSMNAGNYQI